MDEKNPLQVFPMQTPICNGKVLNKRGRPTTGTIIKFGPQPKSIIAQMLSEMKTESKSLQEPTNEHDQLQNAIKPSISEEHLCQTCPYRSANIKEYKKHLSSHQLCLCDFPNCSYSCKLSSNLIKHKRVHTNEKPYLCERCSFRTNFVNSLKAHKRTHTAEKPYHCKHCDYKCNSSSNLKKHCQLRHPEENKCKYK